MAGDIKVRVETLAHEHLSAGMRRKIKYGAVSAINVPLGQAIIAVCVFALGWDGVNANVAAIAVTTVPAYLLNRAWVWDRVGNHSVLTDVAPFWAMALFGLFASTAVVGWAEGVWSPKWVANVASLAAFGVIWVAKYLVLDRLMFGRDQSDHAVVDDTAPVPAESGTTTS